ncbi:MAG: hypothetical protein Q8M76_08800, partial [Spirochaetaceae bacterium]|nr:hypothetical protein [Spirochaetaceae bacterium]
MQTPKSFVFKPWEPEHLVAELQRAFVGGIRKALIQRQNNKLRFAASLPLIFLAGVLALKSGSLRVLFTDRLMEIARADGRA